MSARRDFPDLSIPAKLSLSGAVSVGKSSSVSLAFPAAIFFPSSPPEEAEPRLRAAAQAAAARDTPHDCMGDRDAAAAQRAAPAESNRKNRGEQNDGKLFSQDEKMRFDVVNPFGGTDALSGWLLKRHIVHHKVILRRSLNEITAR